MVDTLLFLDQTICMHEPTTYYCSFDSMVVKFQEFLEGNNYDRNIQWIFEDDVHIVRDYVVIKAPLPDDGASDAKVIYDLGMSKGACVTLAALCKLPERKRSWLIIQGAGDIIATACFVEVIEKPDEVGLSASSRCSILEWSPTVERGKFLPLVPIPNRTNGKGIPRRPHRRRNLSSR